MPAWAAKAVRSFLRWSPAFAIKSVLTTIFGFFSWNFLRESVWSEAWYGSSAQNQKSTVVWSALATGAAAGLAASVGFAAAAGAGAVVGAAAGAVVAAGAGAVVGGAAWAAG